MDLVLWLLARSSGTGSAVALELAILSGMALRTGALGWLTHNRGVRVLHDSASILWLPLAIVHVVALLLDPTARINVTDLVVPFGVPYGTIAIGLGTISAQLLGVVMVSTWLRPRIPNRTWTLLHRLSYPAFVAVVAHSLLAGTDLSQPLVAGLAWITVVALAAVGITRVLHPAKEPRNGAGTRTASVELP